MHRIFSLFCTEAGLKPPYLLPHWIAYTAGLMLELFGTLFKSKAPPLLTRGRVNMFYDSIGVSVQKAYTTLGFSCDYSLEQGIRKTVAWYQKQGLLKTPPHHNSEVV